jgi:hypothetical protein
MVAAGSGIITGIILDMYGPGVTVILSGIMMAGGSIVFGWKLSGENGAFSYLFGYAMLALGGMAVLISAFRVAYVFPEKQAFVIGGISCLFDSSTVVFVLFEALNSSIKAMNMHLLFTM